MFLSANSALQKLKTKSVNMSTGVFTPPAVMENVTNTFFHGFGSVGGGLHGGVLDGGPGRQPMGKKCVDLHKRLIEHGVHFVPGPDECTLCACDDGEPKWCKAVLCSPPTVCYVMNLKIIVECDVIMVICYV